MLEGYLRENDHCLDCLYLNIWKPSTAKAGDNLPVIVYIHVRFSGLSDVSIFILTFSKPKNREGG